MNNSQLQLDIAASTHAGKIRSGNQDCVAVNSWICQTNMEEPHCITLPLNRLHCVLVADGLGGHPAGEIASNYAANYFCNWVSSQKKISKEDVNLELRELNRHLFNCSNQPNRWGMGCTIAGLIIDTEKVLIFNVGDAVVFRENHGFLTQLSVRDTPNKIYGDQQWRNNCNIVSQCLGGTLQYSEIHPHVREERIAAERSYLISTDGLIAALNLETIESLIKENSKILVDHLQKAALANEAPDNFSLIILRIVAPL